MTESNFIEQIGTWELNPKSGLEITKGFGKGVWLVLDTDKKVAKKGNFDEAYTFYTSDQTK